MCINSVFQCDFCVILIKMGLQIISERDGFILDLCCNVGLLGISKKCIGISITHHHQRSIGNSTNAKHEFYYQCLTNYPNVLLIFHDNGIENVRTSWNYPVEKVFASNLVSKGIKKIVNGVTRYITNKILSCSVLQLIQPALWRGKFYKKKISKAKIELTFC